MIIDCGTCAVRDLACGDCVVSVLLGPPGVGSASDDPAPVPVPVRSGVALGGGPVELDGPELAALQALAGSGLVPPLRLVPPPSGSGERTEPGSGRAATA